MVEKYVCKSKIWRKVKRKDKTLHFIKNIGERKIENKEEYQKYYERLLQARPQENLQEKKVEQEINAVPQKIIRS